MGFSSDLVLLNSKTAGKDKIYRTVQYACKMLWYLLWKNRNSQEYINILKKIETAMSQTRKVLRFGTTHEMIESALKSIHSDDHFLRYVLTASNINQALYLLLDNALWLNSIGVVDLKAKETRLLQYSNKFWLFSSILSLARDFNGLISILQNDELIQEQRYESFDKYKLNQNSGAYSTNVNPHRSLSLKRLILRLVKITSIVCLNRHNHPLLLDFLKNFFDLFLPLNSLNFVRLSPGMVGLCGLMSSLIGLMTLWDSRLKLKS